MITSKRITDLVSDSASGCSSFSTAGGKRSVGTVGRYVAPRIAQITNYVRTLRLGFLFVRGTTLSKKKLVEFLNKNHNEIQRLASEGERDFFEEVARAKSGGVYGLIEDIKSSPRLRKLLIEIVKDSRSSMRNELKEQKKLEAAAALHLLHTAGISFDNIDLSGVNLSGVDLSGFNLSGFDLNYANLNEANLSEVNLSEANGFIVNRL